MTTQTKLILVTGATGQQGGAVARALLANGQKIRVVTRSPEKASLFAKAGAEVVKGDLTNKVDLQSALRGVHGVFAMFMENFTTFSKPSPEGVLTMPMWPERKLAMVALRDIGEFGAAAFTRPKDFLGQAIDLAGMN
ncbi:MAG: NmrA family NAD(P)-binding protein [Nitrospiraceae bacterium]